MKKFITVLLYLLIPSFVWAAGSSLVCTRSGGDTFGTMQLSCVWTANSSDATFVTVPLCIGTCTATSTPIDFTGWKFHNVVSDIGATGPTDNSDLYLLQGSATGRDVLGGAGVDLIDNADATPLASSYALVGGDPAFPFLFGPLYMKLINNAVNSATGTLIFTFNRHKG